MRPKRPIIILGAARSGTKFLRDTLAASRFASCTPYDLNYIWRAGNESYPDDALPATLCSDGRRDRIKFELRRAAGIDDDDNERRLIEKTVSNTLRVPFVAKVFPDADFIHIIRDGRAVVSSSYQTWHTQIDWRYLVAKVRSFPLRHYRYALWYAGNRLLSVPGSTTPAVWGVRYPGIAADAGSLPVAAICARQWVASTSSVRRAVADIAEIRYTEIRYEDLVSSDAALLHLVRWISLPDEQRILDRYHETVRKEEPSPWYSKIPETDRDTVLTELEPTLRELRYL